ncbi:MAG: septum formation initiator family protein [Synergistaceae bacterium]|nr:septum formation initiator family protein [Synergistaceae bacterium]MBQ3347314.1 septum formation initiator family protein [Synergistaceae bacterium]MBQ3398941.1 septum formation initiator family protein [Synergistaceae bacterium]MBR0184481.1 septum formation initiator family protein [Synergistaceae bacterium]
MPSLRQILLFALALLGLAITWSYYRFELDRIAEIREQIVKSEAVLKEKRDSVRDYKEKVEFYKTQGGVEHLAREQYNLIGNGERVILLKSPDADPEY